MREDLNVSYGSLLTGPDMEPLKGYHFVWQLGNGGTMPAHDIVITGEYQKHIYTIVYYIDDVFFAVQEIPYGDPITPLHVTPPHGKVFSGWDITYTEMPDQHLTVFGSFIDPEVS